MSNTFLYIRLNISNWQVRHSPSNSTLKLTIKVFVLYYISWIMNIKRHLKPKLLVHGPHTKTTEMGYKKSTSAQRNNSPCIRQSGNAGAPTRAIRVKIDTTELKWVRWRVSGCDCTTVTWLPISLSDKTFSQQVSGKTMNFINSNLIKEMCEDVVKPILYTDFIEVIFVHIYRTAAAQSHFKKCCEYCAKALHFTYKRLILHLFFPNNYKAHYLWVRCVH